MNTPSMPVQIPSQRTKRPTPVPIQQAVVSLGSTAINRDKPRRGESVQDLLMATAIPVRKRPKGRAIQRLPDCDHVADFSKLLLGDINDGSLSGSLGNPQFDGLFGKIDEFVEGQIFVGSEGADSTVLSARSASSESMPSLASPDDFMSNDTGSPPLSFKKSPSDRRLRQLVTSEECGSDHPLLRSATENSDFLSIPDLAIPTINRLKRRPNPPRSNPGSLKSTLSASLRALKSAAQTVSNIAMTPPILQPEDYLTRSIFSIQPALTDDKRPPPSSELPSPALRRYLNPLPPNTPPDSPRHLHFWHDDRPSPPSSPSENQKYKPKIKRKSKKGDPSSIPSTLPSVVPLQSCIPPAVRTAHASSPPIWLAPDGTPSNKNTAHAHAPPLLLIEPGMPRQREPRENRDFLRVLVAEMNMRRAGKLADGKCEGGKGEAGKGEGGKRAGGKAALWLPPVKEDPAGVKRKTGAERWVCHGVDDL